MTLQCFNKGCGLKFEADEKNDSCVFHPGVPIFHDALKGWSCCRKRTTDFSEFLSIKGCTKGPHNPERPQEPLRPEVSSDKTDTRQDNGLEIIYQGPKSAESLQRERPCSEEVKTRLPHTVSSSLSKELEKLDVSRRAEIQKKESQTVMPGTRCKNAGCKTVYQDVETDKEVCSHHPGGPVFHEGYKYWSCCCIRTIDFNAFLDQKGCSTGNHRWIPKQDKKKVSCRFDWHQTSSNVVITIYAKNSNPASSAIEANQTVISCLIHFENNKIFKREFHLWGVADVKRSSVNMVASKVEIRLGKADPVSWGKLEDPNYKPEPEPEDERNGGGASAGAPRRPEDDIDDDDISEDDDDWAYDTPEYRTLRKEKARREEEARKKTDQEENKRRKEVEKEMKAAAEERKRKEEEKKKLEEKRRMEEGGQEGFEDMPELEDD